jgi:uncharacterized protein YqgV (UPF0045/DUF77 family)
MMIISVEISFYPLVEDFAVPVNTFIQLLDRDGITVEPGKMSTIITGEFDDVMSSLTNAMGDLMKGYPSVFTMKISNSCQVK